jgi:hypothetical protein
VGRVAVPASAASETQTFLLVPEVPNTAVAPNGDTVAITGEGEFSVFSELGGSRGRVRP